MSKPNMGPMPNMLAYTLTCSVNTGVYSYVIVGFGNAATRFSIPGNVEDSYWILILDATNPANKVKDFVFPGSQNTAVPAGLDNYLKSPQYLFAVLTQSLISTHVPQGDFYDYLMNYGAGRQLQKLEQLHSVFPGCGSLGRLGYMLVGQGGPRGIDPNTKKPIIPPPSYELGSGTQSQLQILMSLMPGTSGPPYSLCDSYTFKTR